MSDTPVIMLTARGEDVDQVRGLELGADDYVPKPFSHLALMARIKAVLRRAEMPPPIESLADFVAGDVAIHFQNQQVTVAGQQVKLTPPAPRDKLPPGVGPDHPGGGCAGRRAVSQWRHTSTLR